MKLMKILFAAVVLLVADNQAYAQRILAEKSKVNFSLSNMGINKVKGTFGGFVGNIDFNPAHLDESYFDVSIKVNTIKTGIDKRDRDVLDKKFFDADKYPVIRFKSTKIEKAATGYMVTGNLTMKDVTKSISFPFTFSKAEGDFLFKGSFVVNRKDYHVGESYSNFMAGDEVNVTINCITAAR